MFRFLIFSSLILNLAACQIFPTQTNLADVDTVTRAPEISVVPSPAPTATLKSGASSVTSTPDHQTTNQVKQTANPVTAASQQPQPTVTSVQRIICPIGQSSCVLEGHFLFRRPIGSDARYTIDTSYRYGMTQAGKREPHHGVEFPNAQGTAVLAAQDGVVIFAGNDKQVSLAWVPAYYGNVIVIEHQLKGLSQKVFSLYAHLYTIGVKVGQHVVLGEHIGQVGATGTAIGSHLHFEVRQEQNNYLSNRNPELWLSTLDGMGVIAGRIENGKGELTGGMINVQRIENGVVNLIPVTSMETYVTRELQPVKNDDTFQENFAAGGLAAGVYRLTLHFEGFLYEQVIKIEPGKLTYVIFKLK